MQHDLVMTQSAAERDPRRPPESRRDSHIRTRAVSRNPEDLAAEYFEHGKAQAERGELDRAEASLVTAMVLGASEDDVLPHLLRACIMAARYSAAIDYAKKRLARGPSHWQLRLLVSSCYCALGLAQTGRDQLQLALREREADPAIAL
jgi:predicted Zn-dependent protease